LREGRASCQATTGYQRRGDRQVPTDPRQGPGIIGTRTKVDAVGPAETAARSREALLTKRKTVIARNPRDEEGRKAGGGRTADHDTVLGRCVRMTESDSPGGLTPGGLFVQSHVPLFLFFTVVQPQSCADSAISILDGKSNLNRDIPRERRNLFSIRFFPSLRDFSRFQWRSQTLMLPSVHLSLGKAEAGEPG